MAARADRATASSAAWPAFFRIRSARSSGPCAAAKSHWRIRLMPWLMPPAPAHGVRRALLGLQVLQQRAAEVPLREQEVAAAHVEVERRARLEPQRLARLSDSPIRLRLPSTNHV
jgi:hypothetical protein